MDYQAADDEALVRLVRENDPEAFPALSARYLRLIRSQAEQYEGPSVPEREDLLQEGFLGLYAAALTFSPERGASFRTYAGACVRNRMASALRKHRSRGNRPLNESLSLDSEGAFDLTAESGPEDLLEARDRLRELLERVNAALSPLEKKALVLYLSGCGRSEIPARSGLSLRAFDNAVYRARNKLKGL